MLAVYYIVICFLLNSISTILSAIVLHVNGVTGHHNNLCPCMTSSTSLVHPAHDSNVITVRPSSSSKQNTTTSLTADRTDQSATTPGHDGKWVRLAATIDRVLFVIFLVATIIASIVYLVVILEGSDSRPTTWQFR